MPRFGEPPYYGGSREKDSVPHADTRPQSRVARPLPLEQWKVLLHADDLNEATYIVEAIEKLTPLDQDEAAHRQQEADRKGESLLLTTHHERAELYERQFGKANLHVTIAPIAK